jgi:hypothetical protein
VRCPGHTIQFLNHDYSQNIKKVLELAKINPEKIEWRFTVVYDILKKKEEGNLKDQSRAPLRSPYKTPGETESESCINFCEYFISNIADLWQSAELGLKQRFQKLIFPENISYKKGRFQTTKIALIFKAFDEKSSPNYCQAPPSGQNDYRTFCMSDEAEKIYHKLEEAIGIC